MTVFIFLFTFYRFCRCCFFWTSVVSSQTIVHKKKLNFLIICCSNKRPIWIAFFYIIHSSYIRYNNNFSFILCHCFVPILYCPPCNNLILHQNTEKKACVLSFSHIDYSYTRIQVFLSLRFCGYFFYFFSSDHR